MRFSGKFEKMQPFFTVVSFIVMLMIVGNSYAATYYVAKNGSNSNSGTESKPLQTISAGLNKLKAGDTLFVKSGTYNEAFFNKPTSGTSWSNPTRVAVFPGDSVTIKPSSGSIGFNFTGTNFHHIIIDGFKIVGGHGGVKITDGHHMRFSNLEITGYKSSGLIVVPWQGAADFNEFINLKVHDNNPDSGKGDLSHGIYIASSNNLVENSQWYNITGWGIQLYLSSCSKCVNDNIIRGNIMHDNGTGGAVIARGQGNLVYNNISYNHTFDGLRLDSGNKAYNNTLYKNNAFGISGGTGVKNNILYKNGGAISGGSDKSNNFTSNPQFVDESNFNFKLQPNSPAIDAGMFLSDVQTDIEGMPRPQGSSYDIGAYEIADGQNQDTSPPVPPSGLNFTP